MENKETSKANDNSKIQVLKNGPYLVSGNIPLFPETIKCDSQGTPVEWVIGNKLTNHTNIHLMPMRRIQEQAFLRWNPCKSEL